MSTSSHCRKSAARSGFTLLELLFVIGLICILIALLLPAVRYSREGARRSQCTNNLKQLGIALHNYHDVYGHFPSAMGGTGVAGNANRLSGLVAMLPYLEQVSLWEQISRPAKIGGTEYPAMGPAPWVWAYDPWKQQLPLLRCPSAASGPPTDCGTTNYTFCIGDMAQQIHEPTVLRGAFACGLVTCLTDITDGASHTIAMGEIGIPSGRLVVGQFATHQSNDLLKNPSLCRGTLSQSRANQYADSVQLGTPGRGGRWADGAAGYNLINTILPSNSPSCAVAGSEAVDGIYSAGSFHPGGVQVVMADCAVRFVAESIDAGNPHELTPRPEQIQAGPLASPYGVWGAMGTAAGQDAAE
ncbi:MAG: DUF1559 domain-containing protein [Planctomycetaceae bacterium]|nr:DUF1559 domain-containing protein [Planctomycetaceae bacterium]